MLPHHTLQSLPDGLALTLQAARNWAGTSREPLTSMKDSSRLCLNDAESLAAAGRYADAARRALRSLSYSRGVLSADYRQAASWCAPLLGA